MKNTIFLLEDEWKESQRREGIKCLVRRIQVEQSIKAKAALDYFSKRYPIISDGESVE